jgi:hypothetical protein
LLGTDTDLDPVDPYRHALDANLNPAAKYDADLTGFESGFKTL